MRLTEKRNNEIGYGYKEYSSEGSRAITLKLGQLEDLLEKYEIEDIAGLEKILADYDNSCMLVIQFFIFLKKHNLEEQFGKEMKKEELL